MTQEIEAIGLAMDTSGVEKGIKSLETLAATGPKVEKSMSGVEGAATRVNKSLATLGQGNASNGLSTVAKASDTAATSVKKVGDAASKSAREIGSIDSAAGGAGSSLAGLSTAAGLAARAVAAIGIGASVGEFVRMADASTNVASRIGLVTSSAAELASVQQRLFGIAQSSRVSFTDLVGTYAQVARSTKDLGVSQTALLGVIQTISQAVTISGGSAASAQAALTQLSQGFASGALRGEELNSILEQTPRLAQALADGLGVGVGKLRELGQAGELTSEKVLGALEKSAAGVAAEFGKMAVTVEQASTNAANSVLRLVGAFDRLFGVTSAIGGAIQTISNGLDFLSGTVDKLGSQGPLRDAAREVINLDAAAKRLRTGMQSGVLGPNAQGELDRINARLAEAKQRFRELDQQLSGVRDPRDQSGFTGRGASYANEAARQAKLREDANAFRLNQAGVPASYLKDMAELIRLNQAGVIVGKEYTDALKAQQDTLLKKTGAVKGSAAAANAEQNAYESLIQKLGQEIPKAAAEAEAAQMGYNKTQTEFLALAGSPTWASFTNSQRAVVASMFESKIASEQAGDAVKELSKAYAEAAAERIKTIQSMERAADGLQSQNDALRAEIELIGLSTEQQTLVLQQRNDVLILTKEATLAELERQSAITGTQTRVEIALASEIEALKERNALLGAKGVKNAAVDAAKTAKDEWQKTTDSINQSLTDSLLRGFESGKDMARNLRDTVVSMFKTMVLRPVISAVLNPISQGITGMMGLSGAAQAATGGAGALSTVGSIGSGVSMLSGLGAFGGGVAGGFGGLMGSLGMSATGATFGGAMSAGSIALGAGNIAGGLGTLAGALGPIALGIAALAAIFGKKATPHAGAASTYSEAGGLVSGADIYRASGLADTRTYNAGVEQVTGNVAKAIGDTLNATARTFGQTAGYEISTAFADDTSKDGAWGSLIIKQMGEAVIDWRDTQTSKWAPKEFADGEKGSAEYLAAVAKSARDAIISIGLPEWAERLAKAAPEPKSLDDLNAMMQQISQYPAQLLQSFGTSRDAMVQQFAQGLASGDAASAGQAVADTLVASIQNAIYTNAAGQIFDIVNQGIVTPMLDAIATGASVADALSQATIDKTIERAKAQAQVLGELFGNAEFAAAMEQLRTAVGGALGQAGGYLQALPQTLVATQQIDTAAQDAARAADEAQKAWQQITDGLLSDQGALQIELLRAQGREEEALARERTLAIEGMDAYQTALYDSNQAIKEQISGIAKAAEEMERMAEVSRTLASELPAVLDKFRTPEQRTKAQYSSIAGDLVGAGLSGADVGSLAGALESMSKEQIATAAVEIYNMAGVTDDMRLALVRAVAGLGELKDAALEVERAIAAERTGLEGQILQLQGKTAELRSRELAALDESNRSLQKRIYILQDEDRVRSARDSLASGYAQIVGAEQAARDGITSGFLAAQDALDAVIARGNDALRDMASGIRDFVQGIDASEAGGLGIDGRLAAAQANFSIAKAQALSGDSNAQQSLTGLAGDVLALAKDASASQSDYLREVARIKNSLGDVAAQADGKAGPATEATQTEMLKAQQEVQRWAEAAAISGASTTEAVKSYSADWAKAQHDLMQANAMLSEAGIAASALNVKQPLDDLRASIETLTGAMRDLAAFDPGNKLLDEITNGTGGALPGGSAGVSAGVFDEAALRTMYREGAMLNSEAMTAAMQITMGGGSLDGYSHAAAAGWTEQQKLTERFFSNIQRSLMMDSQIAAAMSAQGVNSVIDWLASVMDYKTGSFVLENGAGGGRSRYQLPGFASGINRVPYDMTANLHRDEAVIPAQFNPFNPGARAMQSDPELLAELKALRAEVASLRQSNSSENAAIAGSSLRAAKVLERVAPNGDAIATRAAEELA